MRAARSWLAARPDKAPHAALNELLIGEFGRPEWLLEYWSAELLFSVLARRVWVEPHRKTLPF